LLLPDPWDHAGRRHQHDRQRLLQAGLPEAPDGVRGGSSEADWREPEPRRNGRLSASRSREETRMLEIKNLQVKVGGKELLKGIVNAIRKYRGLEEIDAMDFMGLVQDKAKLLGLDETFMKRGLNEGFSGGEKKKNEVFQMAVLEPKFCILDETDSGLDIDALRLVANGINTMRSPTRSMLVVTHYQRLLDYVIPEHVHVLVDGRIVKSGDADLARNLEKHGYGWILEEAPRPQPARA